MKNHRASRQGFTIVELLVVIVIIGILAAVTLVSYSGLSQRANIASVQSDLSTSAQKLKMYYTEYGSYPRSPLDSNYCPQLPTVDSKYCLKASPGTVYSYTSSSPWYTFTLLATKGSDTYKITESTQPVDYAPIFASGGTITNSGGNRIHTFGTGCTSSSPCTLTAMANGTITVTILGAGGGGGGSAVGDSDGQLGSAGGPSKLTHNGLTYIANGGGGGCGGSNYPPYCSTNGAAGSVSAFGLTGVVGGGSSGGIGGDSHYDMPGAAGGPGGRVSGNLVVTKGQVFSIVVGQGGTPGGADDYISFGTTGGHGSVTLSYPE